MSKHSDVLAIAIFLWYVEEIGRYEVKEFRIEVKLRLEVLDDESVVAKLDNIQSV